MNRLAAAVLSLALALPAAADRVDLGAVFDDDFRDQCDTGSCHAFASVALLEAALRRRARDSEPVMLSDADLFLRTKVLDAKLMSFYRDDPSQIERELVEGGWPTVDLRYALKEGVARAESVPWDRFLVRFRDYRKRRLATADLPEPADRLADDTAFFYGEGDPESLPARLEALRLERREVLHLLRGFTVHSSTFPAFVRPPAECAAEGKAVSARLMEDLAVRRPVVLCLKIGGLSEWGSAPRFANHCIAIRGYTKPRGGPMTLLTRNSWGEDRNPDIPEDRFCRIYEVVSVRP